MFGIENKTIKIIGIPYKSCKVKDYQLLPNTVPGQCKQTPLGNSTDKIQTDGWGDI